MRAVHLLAACLVLVLTACSGEPDASVEADAEGTPSTAALSYVCAIGIKATGAAGVFRGTEGAVHPLLLLSDLRRT